MFVLIRTHACACSVQYKVKCIFVRMTWPNIALNYLADRLSTFGPALVWWTPSIIDVNHANVRVAVAAKARFEQIQCFLDSIVRASVRVIVRASSTGIRGFPIKFFSMEGTKRLSPP